MARGRAASYTLALLLLLLFIISAVTASPARNTPRQHSTAPLPSVEGPSTTSVKGGEWNVSSIIGITVGIIVTLLVILALSNTVYHRHASLRIHQQLLERISRITQLSPPVLDNQPPDTSAGAGTGRPHAPRRMTPGVASEAYHLALLMSSAAHLSPNIYSAIQEQIQPMLSSPVVPPAESKMRAPVVEDKVLGRREDIASQGRQSGQAGVEGPLVSMPRLDY